MKKVILLGLIVTIAAASVSAKEVSTEKFRRQQTVEGYYNHDYDRHERRERRRHEREERREHRWAYRHNRFHHHEHYLLGLRLYKHHDRYAYRHHHHDNDDWK